MVMVRLKSDVEALIEQDSNSYSSAAKLCVSRSLTSLKPIANTHRWSERAVKLVRFATAPAHSLESQQVEQESSAFYCDERLNCALNLKTVPAKQTPD